MLEVSNFWMTRQTLTRVSLGLIILTGACSAGTGGGPSCKISLSGISESSISGSSLNDRELVLTFDRAPSKSTEEIAAYLSSRSIGATFFIEGQKIKGEGILSTLRESGHLIGNGTLSHARITQTPALLTEIRKVDQIIGPYVVGDMFLFRAPEGEFNKETAEYLNRQGLQKYVGPVGWDLSVEPLSSFLDLNCDDDVLSVSICATKFFDLIAEKKRGILRLSSTQADLPLFLRELIPNLEAAKFQFRRLDQVPDIRRELVRRDAQIDTSGGSAACDDYGRS